VLLEPLTHHCLSDTSQILAGDIQRTLGIQCEVSSFANETQRLIRSEFSALVPSIDDANMTQMNLGLSHSLSRYKIKFSPDKVDTMIVQAVALLDDLDKELNTYAMRAREWYGWHFPELAKILNDNETFCRVVKVMGDRTKATVTDFEGVLEPEMAEELKEVTRFRENVLFRFNPINRLRKFQWARKSPLRIWITSPCCVIK
jgi:nucleolar protein 58